MFIKRLKASGGAIRKHAQSLGRARKIGAGLFVAIVGAAWMASAQVGTGGVIFGCLSPSGFIRGIDEASGSCRTGDTALSWYTKGGADTAFLGKLGKAADADLLDGLDSIQFLRTTTMAGGALTGMYPSPSLAPNAVDTATIQNGAVTAAKLGVDVNFGRVRSDFLHILRPFGGASDTRLITVADEIDLQVDCHQEQLVVSFVNNGDRLLTIWKQDWTAGGFYRLGPHSSVALYGLNVRGSLAWEQGMIGIGPTVQGTGAPGVVTYTLGLSNESRCLVSLQSISG